VVSVAGLAVNPFLSLVSPGFPVNAFFKLLLSLGMATWAIHPGQFFGMWKILYFS
jgi:hypothetical protein